MFQLHDGVESRWICPLPLLPQLPFSYWRSLDFSTWSSKFAGNYYEPSGKALVACNLWLACPIEGIIVPFSWHCFRSEGSNSKRERGRKGMKRDQRPTRLNAAQEVHCIRAHGGSQGWMPPRHAPLNRRHSAPPCGQYGRPTSGETAGRQGEPRVGRERGRRIPRMTFRVQICFHVFFTFFCNHRLQ